MSPGERALRIAEAKSAARHADREARKHYEAWKAERAKRDRWYEEADRLQPVSNVYRDERVHVLTEMCATCIFRPHERPVEGARVAELVRETRDFDGANVPCHKTLYQQPGEPEHAICRGWWDRFSDRDWIMRLAKSMDIVVYQEPPA